MSQDMMQALSGSSLLSLSVGTLPALKSGMMLDANPFASQLALMTAPETAMSGAASAVGDGVAGTQFATALAQAVAPVAGLAADTASLIPDVAGSVSIAALPEDASPSQIIEAALGGTMKPAPVVVQPHAPAAKLISALPVAETPATNAAKPQAPATQPATGTDALHPIMPEAVALEEIPAETDRGAQTARPRRAAKPDAAVPPADTAAPIAAPVVEPVLPAPFRPQAYAPDTGNVRVAISANPAPVAAPAPTPAPAPAAANAPGAPAAAVIAPVVARQSDPLAAASTPTVSLSQPRSVAALAKTSELSPATQPGESAGIAQPNAPTLATDRPVQTFVSVAPQPAQAQRPATAPAIQSSPVAVEPQVSTPAQPDAVVLQAPVAAASPDAKPAAAPVASVDPEMATSPSPVAPGTADPAATAAIVLPGHVPVQQRSATPVPRGTVSATGLRAIQAASQSARPADALGAVMGLGDPVARLPDAAFADATRIDAISAAPVETVPPAWAAALNAVVSPVTTNAAFGLTAASATGNPGAAQLETLAFDAGFVGNVETQIARVIGGGQMVRMQLSPENLGRIDIEMLAGPKHDQIRIITEHDAVRDTLAQSQVRLEQDLRNNGNRNTDITVELRQPSTGTQGGAAQQQRGQSGSEAGMGRDSAQRQTASDALADSETAQRRPRDNVRYA